MLDMYLRGLGNDYGIDSWVCMLFHGQMDMFLVAAADI